MRKRTFVGQCLLVGMLWSTLLSTPEAHAASPYLFGTLETDNGQVFDQHGWSPASIASQEHAAGVAVAQVTIAWKDYEPSDGVYNEGIMAWLVAHIQAFGQAGQKVDVAIALHYSPAWVAALPNARYVNQYGVPAPHIFGYDDPNYVFNATVRQKVRAFETHVLQQLHAQVGTLWDFRIDGGAYGEAGYSPSNDNAGHTNSYWAYDANAQGIGGNLPAGVSSSPFPGWKPGQTSYHGQPFTLAQVQAWYGWYFHARMNYYNWQIALYRNAGVSTYLTLETPGIGTRPDEYTTNMQQYLSGDPNGTMSRAAVWQKVYPAITHKANVIAYISSLADGSGGNDLCQAGDSSVDLSTDPVVDTWSAVRYISAIADRYGFQKGGENPGYGSRPDYGVPMLDHAAAQMRSCGLMGMFWAHDERLYTTENTPPANIITLSDYAQVINQYN